MKEAILLTIRDNIPVEKILQSYMEESEEVEVLNMQQPPATPTPTQQTGQRTTLNEEGNNISNIPVDLETNPILTNNKLETYAEDLKNELSILNTNSINNLISPSNIPSSTNNASEKLKINFVDKDIVIKENGVHTEVFAPKDLNTLQQLATERKIKEANEQSADDNYDKISLGSSINLNLDVIEL